MFSHSRNIIILLNDTNNPLLMDYYTSFPLLKSIIAFSFLVKCYTISTKYNILNWSLSFSVKEQQVYRQTKKIASQFTFNCQNFSGEKWGEVLFSSEQAYLQVQCSLLTLQSFENKIAWPCLFSVCKMSAVSMKWPLRLIILTNREVTAVLESTLNLSFQSLTLCL